MQNDPKDKKTTPEDFIEPTPTNLPENAAVEDNEQDLDDLVHNLPNTINKDEEIDEDDAIHRSARKLPPEPGTEADPDDLVHGN